MIRVIVVGTDPDRPRGGIAVALAGHLAVLRRLDRLHAFVPTHLAGPHPRVRTALRARRQLRAAVAEVRARGETPLVWLHAGGPASVLRKACFARVARRAGARVVVQLHAPTTEWLLRGPARRSLLRRALSPSDRVTVLTPWWVARLRAAGIARPLDVLPNPLPAAAERAARRPYTPPPRRETVEVLAMTRLVEGKRVDVLLRALVGTPERLRCVIAGDGPERERLATLALELGVAHRVRFTGWVDGERKDALLRSCDVFCVPSTRDSFGMGFVEAMSRGRPVVAADYGSVADVVPGGGLGALVPPGDVKAVREALTGLMDRDRREAMGARSQRYVRARFGAEGVTERLRRVLLDGAGR